MREDQTTRAEVVLTEEQMDMSDSPDYRVVTGFYCRDGYIHFYNIYMLSPFYCNLHMFTVLLLIYFCSTFNCAVLDFWLMFPF